MKPLLMMSLLMLPLTGIPASCEAQDLNKELEVATQNTKLEFKVQWCRIAQAAGMPMKVNPELRAKADQSVGAEVMREILLPMARVNNAYGCFCVTGPEKVLYKCP